MRVGQPPAPPVFSAEQRSYLREFNFEALLRKQHGITSEKWLRYNEDDGVEKWVVAVNYKLYCEAAGDPTLSNMRLYQKLVHVAHQIALQIAPCALCDVQCTITFADEEAGPWSGNRDGAECRVALRVGCRLVLRYPKNLLWEALARDNLEMLGTWLCRSEVDALVNVVGGPKGETPLAHVMSTVPAKDMSTLTVLLNHGALPLGIDPIRFSRYASSYRTPVVRAWRAHVRMIVLALLAMAKQQGKRHMRQELGMFAKAVWAMRWKYR